MNMKYGLKVLCTNQRDLSTSLYFHSGENLYLFNLCDGLQRVASQAKLKFGRVKHMFVPRLHVDNFLGLPGFYLTTRDGMKASEDGFKVSLHGPSGFGQVMEKAVYFVGKMSQCGGIFDYEEEVKDGMEVDEKWSELLKTNLYKGNGVKDKEIEIEVVGNSRQNGEVVLSYLCQPTPKRGKLLPKEAKKLGCDPKKHFKLLTSGESVTLDDGTVVTPEQVVEKAPPAESFIINFIPSNDFVDSVTSNPKYDSFLSQNEKVAVVYHSLGSLEILQNEKYLEFLQKFPEHTKHVLDCKDLNTEKIVRYKAMILTKQYSSICPRLYPITEGGLIDFQAINLPKVQENFSGLKIEFAEPGLSFELYPAKSAGTFDADVITHSTLENEEEAKVIQGLLEKKQQVLENSLLLKDFDLDNYKPEKQFDNEPELIFLGTISMKPTSSRSASAIYLNLKGNHPKKTEDAYVTKPRNDFENSYGVLLDCSEATYGQLYDHFKDINVVRTILVNLRLIFITHMHGDHQIGLSKILTERDEALKLLNLDEEIQSTPSKYEIFVCVPFFLEPFLTQICSSFHFPQTVTLISTHKLNPEPQKYFYNDDPVHAPHLFAPSDLDGCVEKTPEECEHSLKVMEQGFEGDVKRFYQFLNEDLGVNRVYAVEAFHCYEAYSVVLESDSWKIMYSGDTMPNQNYVNYGHGATLLIHEATLENGMEEDAKSKCHTTTGQAIEIGQKIGAWRVCLTHFSPRYVKVAEITDEHFEKKVMNAIDHLRLKLSDFEWAYRTLELYRPFEDL